MSVKKDQLDTLHDIRKIMLESSKFLSLSGLSGVFAGGYAILGAFIGNMMLKQFFQNEKILTFFTPTYDNLVMLIISVCGLILLLSISTAYYFSSIKAKKMKHKLFDQTTRKLLFHMAIPLLAGGIFCFALLYNGGHNIYLIAPVMLIFYGISLINGSKYTFHEIRILGLLEISLGLVSLFFPGHGILFWSIGFGILHIIYGILVWYKHDRMN